MLNPGNIRNIDVDLENNVPYIPVLDDPSSLDELNQAARSRNRNISYSGICPSLINILPFSWFLFILCLRKCCGGVICFCLSVVVECMVLSRGMLQVRDVIIIIWC